MKKGDEAINRVFILKRSTQEGQDPSLVVCRLACSGTPIGTGCRFEVNAELFDAYLRLDSN